MQTPFANQKFEKLMEGSFLREVGTLLRRMPLHSLYASPADDIDFSQWEVSGPQSNVFLGVFEISEQVVSRDD